MVNNFFSQLFESARKKGIAFLSFLLCVGCLHSQVTVTVIIKPPYSSYLSDYGDLSNKVIITLKNTLPRAVNIVLQGQLKLNSSESLSTDPDYRPPTPLVLAANELKVITVDHQQLSFLRRNILVSTLDPATWQNIQQTGLLPEAMWQLCVTATEYTNRAIFGTGCTYLSINRANAPVITSPFNSQQIPAKQPSIAFTWTPPAGNLTGAQLIYDLYAVKLVAGQNPNDAINAAVGYKANNPLIKTNLPANQYVTQPYDLKLDTGFTYAVQVIARDLNKQVAFQNDGRSEVITFVYGSTPAAPIAIINAILKPDTKSKGGTFTVDNTDPVPISIIKGKLLYKFKELVGSGSVNNSGAVMNIGGNSPGDGLLYNKEIIPVAGANPLANVKISLVISYVLNGSINTKKYNNQPVDNSSFTNKYKSHFKEQEKVLATTTTSADGSFSFQFVNKQSDLGLNDPALQISENSEMGDHASGKLYKVIRLRVENRYYCSPDVNIKLSPWEGIDLGSLVSYVKSYNLQVAVRATDATIFDIQGGQGKELDKVKTTLTRHIVPQYVPSNEAGNQSRQPAQYNKVVAEKQSNGSGIASFTNLVQHDPDNPVDRYYIKCETAKSDGLINFKTKESSWYPVFDKDKLKFPFCAGGQYNPNKNAPVNIPVHFGEDITWNSQLEIKTYHDTMVLQPERPRVYGKVSPAAEPGALMPDVLVTITNKYVKNVPWPKLFTITKTNNRSLYHFENLDMETKLIPAQGFKTEVIGPDRYIYTSPKGFKTETQKIGLMKWGEQQPHDFDLTPDGMLRGYVEDEEGNPAAATISIDGLASANTKLQYTYPVGNGGNNNPQNNYLLSPNGSRQVFEIEAPSGTNRKLLIDPSDSKYYTFDSTITIPKSGNKAPALVKFVVLNGKKRIRFQVLEKSTASNKVAPASAKPVPGAKVILNITGKTIEQTAGSDGYVSFVFENMASSFSFNIIPPGNTDLEEGIYQVNNVQDSKTINTYQPAFLYHGAAITGVVTLGVGKKPLEGATVYVDLGNGKQLQTKTAADGRYILKGIGMQVKTRKVWASKPGNTPTIISQSQIIELQATNTLDFNLQADNELLIENIYGFAVDIQSKAKRPDGSFLISGKLVNLQGNNNFKLKNSSQVIPFDSLVIKKTGVVKDGIPVGAPASNSFITDLAGMDLILQDAFDAVQLPDEGDRLEVVNENGTGKVVGKINIRKSSFNFSQNYLSFNNTGDMLLSLTAQPGSNDTKLPGIIAGTMPLKKYGLTGTNSNDLNYTYIGFDAKADKSQSFLQGKDLSLYTILNTGAIPGMVPSKLQIDIGALVVHPTSIDMVAGNKPLSFKLEKWDFTAPKWSILQTAGGIGIPAAVIKTGVVDVPVTNVVIKPTDIEIGSFQLNNISFSGVVPLKTGTAKPVFGYNPVAGSDNKPHWELRMTGQNGEPGATIGALPGMKAGEEIKFQQFALISNGEQKITQGNQQQSFRLYNIMDVTPTAFSGGDGYFTMQTMTDLNIPQMAAASATLKYSKVAGQVKLDVLPINITLTGPGEVSYAANTNNADKPITISEGKFMMKGTISDKEGIVLKSVLTRTVNDAWIEVDPKNQKLPLGEGSTYLANIDGKMQADMGAFTWKKFSFSGDMYGFKGISGDTRKSFIVNGSITADNEKMGVKNIPTPFGGLNITYDIKNARFTGNMQLDKQIGAMYINGVADLLVDGDGWYFLAGGKVQTPGIGGLSAGLLLGDYKSMPQNVSTSLMQFAYDKDVPPGFKNGISGFFFTGMKELPVINIPNTSIDLGIMSASFGVQTGLDARLWMDFGANGNEYGIGAMVFAHAYLKGASITCTEFSADARAELGLKGVYSSSNGAFSLKGCGSFTIGGSISQCIPTPCWDGICCKFCAGIGVSKGIKIDLLLDSGGNTDLSFGFGNCSGQSTMTGNW